MSPLAFWSGCLLVVTLGTALRFWNLGGAALWMDEAVTMGLARLPLRSLMFGDIDNHPPLIYVVEHVWIALAPDPSLYRVPFALAGSLSVLVVILMGRDLKAPALGLGAGLILALSAGQIYYSQEARQYVFVLLGGVIAAWGAIGLGDETRSERLKYPLLYVLGGAIAIYSQLTGLIEMAVIGFAALAAIALHKKPWPGVRTWFLANFTLLLITLPWLLEIPDALGTFPGLPNRIPLTEIHWHVRTAVGYPGLAPIHLLRLGADALLFAAAIGGAFLAWRQDRKSIALSIVALVVAYPLIITLEHMRDPVVHVRMFIPVSIGLVFGAGYALATLRDRRLALASFGVFAMLGLASAVNELAHHSKQEDYGAAFAFLDAEGYDRAPVITCLDYSAAAAWEARPDATIYAVLEDDAIRYPGPRFWRAVEMTMVEYRKASTREIDAFLGGGLIVEGGVDEIVSTQQRVALLQTGCSNWRQDEISARLEKLGFIKHADTLIRGRAADYTIIEAPVLNARLFERAETPGPAPVRIADPTQDDIEIVEISSP